MSEVINEAVTALNIKMGAAGFDGTAKFDIKGEGTIVIDVNGARASSDEAEVTLSADAETFKAILDGEQNPTSAFMTGKLAVNGDMGLAMKLAGVLS
jgi:putative sterol carrier protein